MKTYSVRLPSGIAVDVRWRRGSDIMRAMRMRPDVVAKWPLLPEHMHPALAMVTLLCRVRGFAPLTLDDLDVFTVEDLQALITAVMVPPRQALEDELEAEGEDLVAFRGELTLATRADAYRDEMGAKGVRVTACEAVRHVRNVALAAFPSVESRLEVQTVKVRKGTAQIYFAGNRYWSSALTELQGEEVRIHVDPDNLKRGVYVSRVSGELVAFAECYDDVGYDDRSAAREAERVRVQMKKGLRAANAPE